MHTSTPPLPRVLIVEDDTVSGSLLQACIRQANGLPIGPARTADHALDLYATDKPDLVLLDVHLAGQTDGVALASQLRQRNPTIPLLFITGATDDDTYQRAQQLQPVRFVLKPFNPIAVKRIVEAVLLQMTVTAQANAIMNSSKTISLHPPPPPRPHQYGEQPVVVPAVSLADEGGNGEGDDGEREDFCPRERAAGAPHD